MNDPVTDNEALIALLALLMVLCIHININFERSRRRRQLAGKVLILHSEPGPDLGLGYRGGKTACTLPPTGWYCTRTPGHEGPCAAHPAEKFAV